MKKIMFNDQKIVKKVVLAGMLLLVFISLWCNDQPAWINSGDDMAEAFINFEDKDGDGKVAAAEFGGSDSQFNQLDANGDGYIELSEAPTKETMGKMMMEDSQSEVPQSYTATINGIDFEVSCELFTWDDLPDDVVYERQPIEEFTSEEGTTHYYETVYVSSGNLNWYEDAFLADDAGGYLACINSEEENSFVFDLVSDTKYFWSFPENGEHYGISIGPFLGGYQPEGSIEPDGGWSWLSGEPWEYTNWAKNLDDGVIDKDPRPSDQPNNSGEGQPIMGFGEMNLPVPTWGDYMENVGTYGRSRLPGYSYGFVIEYEQKPLDN